MKRFIVGIGTTAGGVEPSAEHRDAITNYLSANEYGYWHWIPDMWLVVSHDDSETSSSLKEKIRSLAQVAILVLRVELPVGESAWSAIGPKQWMEWLKDMWKQGDSS